MKRALKPNIFCVFFLLVLVSHSYSGDIEEDEITIVFPAVTLSKLVNGMLPIKDGKNGNLTRFLRTSGLHSDNRKPVVRIHDFQYESFA